MATALLLTIPMARVPSADTVISFTRTFWLLKLETTVRGSIYRAFRSCVMSSSRRMPSFSSLTDKASSSMLAAVRFSPFCRAAEARSSRSPRSLKTAFFRSCSFLRCSSSARARSSSARARSASAIWACCSASWRSRSARAWFTLRNTASPAAATRAAAETTAAFFSVRCRSRCFSSS